MIRRVAAEALGTAFLLAIVVGSGIMGEKLAAGNEAVALLANAIATGAGLFTLITIFGPISGAHFNPAVTLFAAIERTVSAKEAVAYIAVQFAGAFAASSRLTRCSACRSCRRARMRAAPSASRWARS